MPASARPGSPSSPPFVGAILLPTLVAVAMLVIHARKAHNPMLRPAVIALVLLLLALLVSLAVNGPINIEQLG
jgi:NADH:ubiquinone oxidoreductase subunit 6 (subunit J)